MEPIRVDERVAEAEQRSRRTPDNDRGGGVGVPWFSLVGVQHGPTASPHSLTNTFYYRA